ncbi:hypothetical protein HY485_04760 [Candidatus Woesearchaeota archaeon]|nr:hypothetical protein [Candidatus Woesearchaeota archaeon]
MNDVSNLKDILKASPRSQTYSNALQSFGQLYKGGSQARGYDSLSDKLKNNPQQNFCIACAIAGQPCSKHLKGDDAPIISVDDLLGSISQYAGFVPQSADSKDIAAQQNNGVYLIVDMSNPQSYAVAGAILKAVAQYYATQNGKDGSYSNNDGKAYGKNTYAPASKASDGGKK